MNRTSFRRAGLLSALGLLLVTACAPAVVEPGKVTASAVPRENRGAIVSPPADPKPSVVWPLTGLSAEGASPEAMALASLDIKIENTPEARPQKSLEHADIVFEEYVEFGVSRLMAVFHSDMPAEVGPIRSLRPMDTDIAGSFNGAIVFSGGSAGVIGDAKRTGELLIAEDLHSDGFYRVHTKPAPHNLWAHTDVLLSQATSKTTPPQQFTYAYPSDRATATITGTPASNVAIRLSKIARPQWDWDEASGKWLRSETGYPSNKVTPMTTFDGARVSATNIVVLRVNVTYVYGYLPKTLMIVEDAPGYVLTGGKYVPITWSKASAHDIIHLHTLDGGAVYLAPGNTWVELVPQAGSKDTQSIDFT